MSPGALDTQLLRNVLVHAYMSVDSSRVHEVLTTMLPELREFASHVEHHLAAS
jgi:uncharacterized protein YutE (UPF0331/DUF86 family)